MEDAMTTNPTASPARRAVPRIAVVTGGNRGLGRNTVVSLARKGVSSIITYRSHREEADAVRAEVEALGERAAVLQLDTGRVETFGAFAAELERVLEESWGRGRFDYLVNNAGFGINKSIEQTTEQEFDDLVDVQLKGVFFLTQKLLPLIEDGGRIVNLSSGLARFCHPGRAAYAMMKGGIEVFTRYLAKELGPRGIAANVVAPGAIETDFGGGQLRANADMQRTVAGVTALGRPGVPDDIGPMIASLLSDDNRWVTGQRIEVSGGMYL
jgi:NAD(P)-dependent dehydrogenase (short-subunit alcohol dehydrogenase family)